MMQELSNGAWWFTSKPRKSAQKGTCFPALAFSAVVLLSACQCTSSVVPNAVTPTPPTSSVRVTKHGRARLALCVGNVSTALDHSMPALSPTCQMRSDVIQWSDDNPNTSYYMVTLFHSSIRCQSISYLIDTTNHPQVISVNLDNLTRHLPLHCQNLQTSYLAVQRCASNAPACGLVSECLPADYCAQAYAAPRFHSNLARSATFRINLLHTRWSIRSLNRYDVLQRDAETGNTKKCTLKTRCKHKARKRCMLTCKKLQTCTSYQFCPYTWMSSPGYDYLLNAEYNRTRCADPQRNWLQVTTNSTYRQKVQLTTLKLKVFRLSGTSGLAVFQGDWPSDLEAAPVNLKVCLTARDDGTALCLNRTTRINGEEVFILFNDLLPSVEYEGSGESCLFCGDTACSAIPIRSVLEPNDWLVSMEEVVDPGSPVKTLAYNLHWSSDLDVCDGSPLCTVVAELRCNQGAVSSHQFPIKANQTPLTVSWKEFGDEHGPNRSCEIWIALVLNSSVDEDIRTVPLSQAVRVEIVGLPPTTVTPAIGTTHPHDSSKVIALSLSSAFALTTVVLGLAIALKCRRRRRESRLLSSSLVDDDNVLANDATAECNPQPVPATCHTYDKVKSVRQSMVASRAGRPSLTVVSSLTAAPPLPSAPRPVHILSNPKPNDSEGVYSRLFHS